MFCCRKYLPECIRYIMSEICLKATGLVSEAKHYSAEKTGNVHFIVRGRYEHLKLSGWFSLLFPIRNTGGLMKQYAYIRVSTKDQNIDRQVAAIDYYNIPKKNIYSDYQSGKDFERPEYQKLMKRLRKGDLLVVKSIDRLGRNYDEILEQWKYITKTIKADILIIDMPLLDTRKKDDNLTGTLISDIVLQLLAYVAHTEREFIKQRQAEGIVAAKARGVKLGRTPIEMPKEFEQICHECAEGRLTIRKASELLEVSYTTFYRRYRDYQEKNLIQSDSNSRHFEPSA